MPNTDTPKVRETDQNAGKDASKEGLSKEDLKAEITKAREQAAKAKEESLSKELADLKEKVASLATENKQLKAKGKEANVEELKADNDRKEEVIKRLQAEKKELSSYKDLVTGHIDTLKAKVEDKDYLDILQDVPIASQWTLLHKLVAANVTAKGNKPRSPDAKAKDTPIEGAFDREKAALEKAGNLNSTTMKALIEKYRGQK